MDNYYDTQESKDIQYLNTFNDYMGWFTSITPTNRYDGIDAICSDISGRTVSIELKERIEDFNSFKYNTLFIEPKKIHELTKSINKGEKALYVNFFNKGEVVLIYSMSIPMDIKYNPSVRIFDKGDNKMKIEARFELPLRYAQIYIFNKDKEIYERKTNK